MTIACEASARRMSLSVIPPTALSRMRIGTSSFSSFSSSLVEGLERALDVGLEDQVEALDLLLGHLAVEVLERDGLALAEGDAAGAGAAGLGDLAGAGDVVDDGELLAGGRARRRGRRPRPASTGRPRSIERPLSSNRARTRPKPSPQTITSPTRSVPSCTSTVATTPRPSEIDASRQVPVAGRVGLAFSSLQLGDDPERRRAGRRSPGRSGPRS